MTSDTVTVRDNRPTSVAAGEVSARPRGGPAGEGRALWRPALFPRSGRLSSVVGSCSGRLGAPALAGLCGVCSRPRLLGRRTAADRFNLGGCEVQ